jgi:FKBP-type peptidyl-prolyl cis-trans isomerase FkpA
MIIRLLINTLLIIAILSCNSGTERTNGQNLPGKKEMADLNRYLVQKDRERIESYIERRNLNMKETTSGLWYEIIKEGTGAFLTDNDRIVIEYKCALLDGTNCYSSDKSGPREYILGRSEMEPGLDQGLRMLKSRGEAIFIIPPFLGYGLKGDGNKIPSRSVIVYNIKVLNNK